MKPKKRQKLCHNCEGEVDLDVIVCPFCAADLREEKPEKEGLANSPFSHNPDAKETMQSLYPPPYPIRDAEGKVAQTALQPPMVEKEKSMITPTIFFTLGVQLLLLGLLMLLFSHKGVVILRWEARFWFFYAFASLPCLVFGYRALSRL